jgi:hypothetical protein
MACSSFTGDKLSSSSSAPSSSSATQAEEAEQKHTKADKKELNIVIQREYLIIQPNDAHPILATESVRGGYAIILFHKEKSAILHWDDSTCHTELDKLVNAFSSDPKFLMNTTVHIVGGWKDHIESKNSGDFLVNYFKKTGMELNSAYFQTKKSTNSIKEQGFSLVSLDTRNGQIAACSDTWDDIQLKDNGYYRGQEIKCRMNNMMAISCIHNQDDQYPDSGAHIYPRDQFLEIQESESTKLCLAAQQNKINDLKQLLDEVVTNVSVAPKNAKGNTPLHYACSKNNIDAGILLIRNGADLLTPNEAGKKAIDLIKNDDIGKRKLLACDAITKSNSQRSIHALTTLSIFSRHPDRVAQSDSAKLQTIDELLSTQEGLQQIEESLEQLSR